VKKTASADKSKPVRPLPDSSVLDTLFPAGMGLGAVVEALPHGITVVGRRLRVLYQNTAARNFDGDRVGRPCYEVRRVGGAPGSLLEAVMKDGRPRREERPAHAEPGRILSVFATRLQDENGRTVGALELSHDITELRNRTNRLNEQIRRLRRSLLISRRITTTVETRKLYRKILRVTRDLLELDFVSLMILEPDGRRLQIRDTIGFPESMVGSFSLVEGQGLSTHVIRTKKPDWVHDFRREDRFEIPRVVLEQGIRSGIAAPLVLAGNVFGVLIGHTRKRRRFSGQDLDICQSIANQAAVAIRYAHQVDALRESEARYRDLYDHLPDMYHSLDSRGIILDCNETEARMLGYPKEEIIGRPFSDFLTETSRRRFEEQFAHLSPAHPQIRLEREFRRKDGSRFTASLHVFAEFDDRGRLVKTRTVTRDISERRALETELLKIQKLESLGTLAGGLAHDFNNLLTAILGNINMARLELGPEHRALPKLLEAEKGAVRARDITQQLLTFSKGGAPVRRPASIAELIRESAGFVLRGSNVKCRFDLPEDLNAVEVDEGQISQVIHNLIINADQAMPEGGTIDVIGRNRYVSEEQGLPLPEGRYVAITVRDSGIGIHPSHLHKIFDPFFTTKQKGSGLGLATVYSIVAKHDGHITVESELGSGTAFHVYLPVTDKPVEKRMTGAREEGLSGRGRILLMDDDEMIRDIGRDILCYFGYDVELAEDGEAALALFHEARSDRKPFDLLIMDLTVPGGMGGREAIARIRELDRDVKAIVSSGYSNDPVMASFGEYGFDGVVTKPYNVEELGRAVRKVLSGRCE